MQLAQWTKGDMDAAGVKTLKILTCTEISTTSPILKSCIFARKKADEARWKPLSWTKLAVLYIIRNISQQDGTKGCWKNVWNSESLHVQTVKNDQLEEIPWQNKGSWGSCEHYQRLKKAGLKGNTAETLIIVAQEQALNKSIERKIYHTRCRMYQNALKIVQHIVEEIHCLMKKIKNFAS